jgi:DNA-binding transcriptional LysR family regulator
LPNARISRAELTIPSILQFPVVMTSRFPISLLKQFLVDDKKDATLSTARSFPAIACESVTTMKKIVAGTNTVTLLPLGVIWDEVQAGHLVVLSLAPPLMNIDIGIVQLAHRSLSPIGEIFVRTLQEVDAELSEFEQKNAPKFLAPRTRARSAAKA